MAGNPVTDRYAAAVRNFDRQHGCTGPECPFEQAVTQIIDHLRTDLPALDTTTVGEVILHATAIFNSVYLAQLNYGLGIHDACNSAVNTLSSAGLHLYQPNPVEDLPPLDGTA